MAKNRHTKRDRVNIAIPRPVHAVLRSVAERTGRSIESVTVEAIELGARIKRWSPETEPAA